MSKRRQKHLYPELINQAHQRIHDTFKRRDQSAEAYQSWQNACQYAHSLLERAHSDPVFFPNLAALQAGDLTAIDSAIQYLELDPYYFRSGYHKQYILNLLKRLELQREHRERLIQVLISVVESHDCREFRSYCRLAKKLNDEKFRLLLKEKANALNPDVQRRACWMLKYCG